MVKITNYVEWVGKIICPLSPALAVTYTVFTAHFNALSNSLFIIPF
jgi:hypothetical protein